jgi:ketosteroid isomerase-like protein
MVMHLMVGCRCICFKTDKFSEMFERRPGKGRFVSSTHHTGMTVSAQTQEQVVAVLEQLAGAARSGDAATLAGIADPALEGFWIHTPVRGPAGLAAAIHAPFSLVELSIACEGTIAWVTARLVPGDGQRANGRFTAVLRGTGHAWLLAQIHASLPA